MGLRAVLFGVMVASIASCQARSEAPQKSLGIEAYVEARDLYAFAEGQRAKYGWPALGVGVVFRGQIVALGTVGERQLGSGDWATLDDRFEVGSCAKSITAMVAAALVEEGKLRWDDRALDALAIERAGVLQDYKDVTLEQLLGHRAGLDQWMKSNDRWSAWHREHAALNATDKRLAFAAAALGRVPKHRPGTHHYYCNDGYLIAGSMIEQASGMAFEDFVRQRVFAPLKMDAAGYGPEIDEIQAAAVWGHKPRRFGGLQPIKPESGEFGTPPFGSPAGFLYCSVPDLLGYVDEHMRGANGYGRLLKQESFNRLHAPLEGQQYALGWEVEVTRDPDGQVVERSIYHGGYSGRSRANMWFCPESGWGTVIVCNSGEGDGSEMGEVFHALLRELKITK
jgi:CubicO group peptidase (beta-lactamase class C family)